MNLRNMKGKAETQEYHLREVESNPTNSSHVPANSEELKRVRGSSGSSVTVPTKSDHILSRFLRDDRMTLMVTRVIPGQPDDIWKSVSERLAYSGLELRKEWSRPGTTALFHSPRTFLRFGNPSRLRRALDLSTIFSVKVDVEPEGASPPQTRVTFRCPLAKERLASVLGGASLSGTVGGVVGGGFVTLLAGSAGVMGATLGIAVFAAGSVLAGLPVPGFREYRAWAHRQAEESLEEVLDGITEP